MPRLKAVYALSEPKLPGYEVLASSQQLFDDRPTDVVIEDQPLWYLVRARVRRAPVSVTHSGRRRKQRGQKVA